MGLYDTKRKLTLEDALGPERADQYRVLLGIGWRHRTKQQQDAFADLQKAYKAERKARWMAAREEGQTLEGEPEPVEGDEGDDAGADEAEPVEGDVEGDNAAAVEGDDLGAYPEPPDPPEVVSEREREVRKVLRKALGEWSGWVRDWGVWAPPDFVKRWTARLGAHAIEGYGLLDRSPPRHYAAIAFGATAAALWGIPSLVALKAWRSGAQKRTAAPVEERPKANGHADEAGDAAS